jgi:hypothetical protein
VHVSNNGTAPLNAALAVTGNGFALNGSANIVVAPGGSQDVNIDFSPVAIALYSGTLAITGNVASGADVGLAGEGVQQAALGLDVPNGGESWQFATIHDIQWQSAAIATLRLEYQVLTSGPWLLIADDVPSQPNQYAWTIPNAATSQARVRVTQIGGSLLDVSNDVFSIVVPYYSASTEDIDFGVVSIGSPQHQTVTITNPGSAPLTIGKIEDDSEAFSANASMIVVPPHDSAELEITFSPTTTGPLSATFTLVADDPDSPHTIQAHGEGQLPSDVGDLPTTFGLVYDGPNPFRGSTSIKYRLPERTPVTVEVFDLQGRRVAQLVNGVQGPGEFSVSFGSHVATPAGDYTGTLAAGVYFAQMKAGSFSKTYKLVLAR